MATCGRGEILSRSFTLEITLPGNLIQTIPSVVLPASLCTAFTEVRDYEQLQNAYHDGTIHRSQLTQTSLKTFRLTRRLNAAKLTTLYNFWVAQKGGLLAFWFYNPWEPSSGQEVGDNYDATGASSQGRYAVVFKNTGWSQASDICRTTVPIELTEVA